MALKSCSNGASNHYSILNIITNLVQSQTSIYVNLINNKMKKAGQELDRGKHEIELYKWANTKQVPSPIISKVFASQLGESSEGEAPYLCQRSLDQAGCKSRDVHEWQGPEGESQQTNPMTDPYNISVKICSTRESNLRCQRISPHVTSDLTNSPMPLGA
ncbi:Uncharacterized protein Fot_50621 [Forsythia ovata]|uniref:Uncharacterized protein n=1 Tax=Forsythia ovata TaxID=205694 RepID=A0ABD1PYT6_9LAMI